MSYLLQVDPQGTQRNPNVDRELDRYFSASPEEKREMERQELGTLKECMVKVAYNNLWLAHKPQLLIQTP